MEPLNVQDRRILQDFDRNDPVNIGRPLYWTVRDHVILVEELICADEIEMALKLCDMVPAWYREPQNYPEELTRIKAILYQNLYDQYEYASDSDEAGWTKEDAEKQFGTNYTYPRAEVLREVVGAHNNAGRVPWVFEFSPSHGLLPLGLQREKFKFNFAGKNLNHPALLKLKEWLSPGVWSDYPKVDQPTIMVCCESLEHAAHEDTLYTSYMKLGVKFDEIVLSVPNGCLGHGLSTWRTRRIGHLRGYTPREFLQLADKFFPNYDWKMYVSVSIVLHGKKKS